MKRSLSVLLASLTLASMPVLAQSGAMSGTAGANPSGATSATGSTAGMPGASTTPPEIVEQAPVTVTGPNTPLPSEPTAAGQPSSTEAEPHGKLVKDARHQYKRDKLECRMSTMTAQEYRDCRKAAKSDRNQKIEDASEPRVKP